MQTSITWRADGLEEEHVVERRDRLAEGRRVVDRIGHGLERLGREPAVRLLREPQRRQDRGPAARVLRDLRLDGVVQRGVGRHRSQSPMFGSSEARIAIRSAISTPFVSDATDCSIARLAERKCTRHGLRRAVGDEVAAELAARALDRHVDLAGRHPEALGDELEVVDQRLHRGVQLVPRRQHDLAVVRDPRPGGQAVEDALDDVAATGASRPGGSCSGRRCRLARAAASARRARGRRRTARARAGPSRRPRRGRSGPVRPICRAKSRRDHADPARAVDEDRVARRSCPRTRRAGRACT